MPYSVKGFFEINEDMVQILLMLEILFTQDSKVDFMFSVLSKEDFSFYMFTKPTSECMNETKHKRYRHLGLLYLK